MKSKILAVLSAALLAGCVQTTNNSQDSTKAGNGSSDQIATNKLSNELPTILNQCERRLQSKPYSTMLLKKTGYKKASLAKDTFYKPVGSKVRIGFRKQYRSVFVDFSPWWIGGTHKGCNITIAHGTDFTSQITTGFKQYFALAGYQLKKINRGLYTIKKDSIEATISVTHVRARYHTSLEVEIHRDE